MAILHTIPRTCDPPARSLKAIFKLLGEAHQGIPGPISLGVTPTKVLLGDWGGGTRAKNRPDRESISILEFVVSKVSCDRRQRCQAPNRSVINECH